MKKTLRTLSVATGSTIAAGTALLMNVGTVFAGNGTTNFELPNNITNRNLNTTETLNNSINAIASRVLQIVLLVAGVVAVFYLIYSGFLYLTAGGDAAKAKTARAGIINAIIGIIIILIAFAIVRFAVSGARTINNVI
jgi:type III secretory pathway component EscU